jgi:hypothetical protein
MFINQIVKNIERLVTIDNGHINVRSHLVTVTKRFWPLQVVTSHFLAVTFP